MSKEIVNKVTLILTNTDDNVSPHDLIRIAKEYRCVEFGIPISDHWQGCPKFPSYSWLKTLYRINSQLDKKLHLLAYLCGSWVEDICRGNDKKFFLEEYRNILSMFQRFQLNFYGEKHNVVHNCFIDTVVRLSSDFGQFIIQIDRTDGINNKLFESIRKKYFSVNIVPLIDLSCRTDALIESWPKKMRSGSCGFTGILAPSNLPQQMARITKMADPGPVWIETKINLEKARSFLKASEPWVMYEAK